jgi:hypothetical protein
MVVSSASRAYLKTTGQPNSGSKVQKKRFALCANAHISESRYGAPDFVASF